MSSGPSPDHVITAYSHFCTIPSPVLAVSLHARNVRRVFLTYWTLLRSSSSQVSSGGANGSLPPNIAEIGSGRDTRQSSWRCPLSSLGLLIGPTKYYYTIPGSDSGRSKAAPACLRLHRGRSLRVTGIKKAPCHHPGGNGIKRLNRPRVVSQALGRIRTDDRPLTRRLLFRLSYEGKQGDQRGSNPQPSGPQPDALPLSYGHRVPPVIIPHSHAGARTIWKVCPGFQADFRSSENFGSLYDLGPYFTMSGR